MCVCVYIHTYIYMCQGHSKDSKPLPERRAIAELVLSQHAIVTYKTKKTNSDFCQFLCQWGPYERLEVCDKYKSGWGLELFERLVCVCTYIYTETYISYCK